MADLVELAKHPIEMTKVIPIGIKGIISIGITAYPNRDNHMILIEKREHLI
jgi:hypothetical protein